MLFHPVTGISARLENDLERTFAAKAGRVATTEKQWRPAVDILEMEQAFHIYADLPGVDPKSVEIELENNTLTLKGERRLHAIKDAAGGHKHRERSSGEFVRRFSLPESADTEQITAKSELGVLEIRIPKQAHPGPRKIEVQ